MAAAGDSITRGYDVTLWGCFLSDCPAYSWSTGTNSAVRSQLSRLTALQPGTTVSAANVAKTGAKISDLDRQLKLVGTGVGYVTVLLGANDVCTSSLGTMTPTATFRSAVDTALTNFFQTHPSSYVAVSSIPNVYQLWLALHGNASARSTWRTFGICQSMLSASNSDQNRQDVLKREVQLNRELELACAAFDRCHWDGGAVFGVVFSPGDVSTVDYFHPSAAGQAKLADVSWKAGYWPPR
jgi:lysophospholipase L1-like esterase